MQGSSENGPASYSTFTWSDDFHHVDRLFDQNIVCATLTASSTSLTLVYTYLKRVVFNNLIINSLLVSLSGGPPEQAHRMSIMHFDLGSNSDITDCLLIFRPLSKDTPEQK